MLLSEIPESMILEMKQFFWESIMANFVVEWILEMKQFFWESIMTNFVVECCCFSRWWRFGKLIIKNCSYLRFIVSLRRIRWLLGGDCSFWITLYVVVKINEVLLILYKIYERPAFSISSVRYTWRINELNYDVNNHQQLSFVWFQNICVFVTDRIESSHIFKIKLFKGSRKTGGSEHRR